MTIKNIDFQLSKSSETNLQTKLSEIKGVFTVFEPGLFPLEPSVEKCLDIDTFEQTGIEPL